jgi:hypothetical protein
MSRIIKVTALVSKKLTKNYDSWSISLGATKELTTPEEIKAWKLEQTLLTEDLKELVNSHLPVQERTPRSLILKVPSFVRRFLPIPH